MEVESAARGARGARGAGIDEGLYSRQLYVMGHDAQRRVGEAAVLVVGCNGLGAEVAKNVVLAGVKQVTLWDNEPCSVADQGSNFYVGDADVAARRARSQPTAERLSELNEYVLVDRSDARALSLALVRQYTLVVVCEGSLALKKQVNAWCREAGAYFVACQTAGLFANAFCDFGPEFTVVDTNGEPPVSRMISFISNESPMTVTVHEEARHGFETGMTVRFSEVQGMPWLNDLEPVKVGAAKWPYKFEVPVDSTQRGAYENGGYVHEVKQPVVLRFKPLSEALARPGDFLLTDFAKFGRPELLHHGFQALDAFRAAHGRWPQPGHAGEAAEVVAATAALAAAAPEDGARLDEDALDDKARAVLAALASGARAELAPMTAFLGGVVGQEVLKAVSGKFTPLQQFLYFDAVECLPEEVPAAAELQAEGRRYDSEVAVFGRAFVRKLQRQRLFLVGAGAIGCEMLKNLALMGVATAEPGVVHITDMDKIERSNLNRQFLFRPKDVGSSKSVAAARAARQMNAALNVRAYEDKVAPDTEAVFGDDFMAGLDMVCTALDNVEARLYVDQRCLNYGKPMLESGTLGTKGNTQVVVPHITENYGASRDPPEKSVPVCTLKNFPYEVAHCVQWARDWFEGAFAQTPLNVNQYVSNADFMQRLDAQQNVKVETLQALRSALVTERPRSLEDCIKWARLQFEDRYGNQIKQMLHNFPPGMTTTTGAPFWSGTKRQPTPLAFDPADEQHLGFVMAAANLRAANYGIEGSRDEARFRAFLPKVKVPPFVPKQVKIAENDAELKELAAQGAAAQAQSEDLMDVDMLADNIIGALPPAAQLKHEGFALKEAEFEKDDDTNWHMDFITCASNLRCRNYQIAEADRHETKRIAGKIIPAIATTTALVTGLVCLELYKLVQGKASVEAYKNGFCNLALPFFAFSEPIEVKKVVAGDLQWSIWDKIDIDASANQYTLAEFLQFFQDKYSVEVNMLSYAVSILHSFFSQPSKKEERMKMTMTDLVENVTKKPIDPNAKYLTFEVICVDKDDQDVEFPPVRYRIRR